MKILRLVFLSVALLPWNVMAGVILSPDNVPLASSCVVDVLGTDSGQAQFIAMWVRATYECGPGYYLGPSSTDCTKCIEDYYCPGGDYIYDEVMAQGLNPCPDETVSPEGMYEIAQCGRRFHAGDSVIYMRRSKVTTPSLNVDMDFDGVPDYFINLTTQDVPMNVETERSFRFNIGGVIYSAYDDTISIQNNDAGETDSGTE